MVFVQAQGPSCLIGSRRACRSRFLTPCPHSVPERPGETRVCPLSHPSLPLPSPQGPGFLGARGPRPFQQRRAPTYRGGLRHQGERGAAPRELDPPPPPHPNSGLRGAAAHNYAASGAGGAHCAGRAPEGYSGTGAEAGGAAGGADRMRGRAGGAGGGAPRGGVRRDWGRGALVRWG